MYDAARSHALPRQFVYLAATLGALYLAINPPFAVNDEDVHLARIYELSTGRLVTRSDSQGEYHMVPSDYPEASRGYQGIGQGKKPRVHSEEILAALRAPKPEPPLVRMRARAGAYLPVAYHLQLPVVFLAQKLNVSVFWHLYLARCASLAVYIALGWCAMCAVTGSLQWVFLALGLIPMALTQAAGVSSDGLVIGASLLYFALIAESCVSSRALTRRQFVVLGSCLFIVTLCKPVYILLGICLLLLGHDAPKPLWRRLLPTAVLIAAIVVSLMMRSHLAEIPDSLPNPTHSVTGQLALLVKDPWFALKLTRQTLWRNVDDLLIQVFFVRHVLSDGARFAGAIGGLTYLTLVVILAWGASRRVQAAQGRTRAVVFALCGIATIAAVPAALYLCCNTLGRTSLRGWQGRYLIPALPPLALALSYVGRPVLGRWLTRNHPRSIVAWITLVNLFCLFTLLGWHYYAPNAHWPL